MSKFKYATSIPIRKAIFFVSILFIFVICIVSKLELIVKQTGFASVIDELFPRIPRDEASLAKFLMEFGTNFDYDHAVRNFRNEACVLINNHGYVVNWIGRIGDVTAVGDGLFLTIRLSNSEITTWYNLPYDVQDKTIIASDSTLYKNVIDLKPYDFVEFSGYFISDSVTCIKEMKFSMNTETESKFKNMYLSQPQLLFKLSQIKKVFSYRTGDNERNRSHPSP